MFAPTSLPWLLAHEIRLIWRGSILVRTRRHVLVPIIGVFVLFQFIAVVVAWASTKGHFTLPILIMAANLNIILLGCLMLARAMTIAIDILYARGDVDFLLASPIPPSRVMAVRMAGVTASVASPWLLLGGALANGLALFGHATALMAYGMITALAALATALAFALAVWLVGIIGPRRARGFAYSLSLLLGMAIFALGQAPHYVPKPIMKRFWTMFLPDQTDINALIWLPGRAMLGEAVPLIGFAAFCGAVFLIVLAFMSNRFAAGAISAAGHAAGGGGGQTGNFRDNPFAATMLKNVRLLARFPGLVTQTVYRSLTLVPVAMVLSGRVTIGTSPSIIVPLIVFLGGQIALFFISVIIGSEQAPECQASAPVAPMLGRRAAYAAAGYATLLLMALPVLGAMLREPSALPVLLVFLAGAAGSNLVLGHRLPIPLLRAEFGKSPTGTIIGLIAGVSTSSLWAFCAWLLVDAHPFAVFHSL